MLFFPDQHLGRNTAVLQLGMSLDDCVLYDPHQVDGGLTADQLRAAKMILWKGHCSVHGRFSPEAVDDVRARMPGVQVLVHPECQHEVVLKADLVGSTEFIIKAVEKAAPGSKWAIGTELNLVKRLAAAHPDQEIAFLEQHVCYCATMNRIDLPHLVWALENLAQGHVVNQITVDAKTEHFAKIALQRMLDLPGRDRQGLRDHLEITGSGVACSSARRESVAPVEADFQGLRRREGDDRDGVHYAARRAFLVESPRWHDDRLLFSDWGSRRDRRRRSRRPSPGDRLRAACRAAWTGCRWPAARVSQAGLLTLEPDGTLSATRAWAASPIPLERHRRRRSWQRLRQQHRLEFGGDFAPGSSPWSRPRARSGRSQTTWPSRTAWRSRPTTRP